MYILIPLNSCYLIKKYVFNNDFISFIKNKVIPSMVNRFILDNRVKNIEIISDLNFSNIINRSDKCEIQKVDIGSTFTTNEVTMKLLSLKKSSADIIVQVNPLFPFVSIESLYRAHESLFNDKCTSAMGSYINFSLAENPDIVKQNDIGIFTAYRDSKFRSSLQRASLPCELIRLKAVEMISLRTSDDFKLFELVLNSGYEIQ